MINQTIDTTIYIRELHAHNCGYIIELELDLADHDEESYEEARQKWLGSLKETYPAIYIDHEPEEWLISVYDNSLASLISEHGIDSNLWDILEYRPDDIEPCLVFLDDGNNWDIGSFEDAYVGSFDSIRDINDYLVESFLECNEIPEHLEGYLDEDKIVRDMMYDHYEIDNHLFRNN